MAYTSLLVTVSNGQRVPELSPYLSRSNSLLNLIHWFIWKDYLYALSAINNSITTHNSGCFSLHGLGTDRTENTASKSSSIVASSDRISDLEENTDPLLLLNKDRCKLLVSPSLSRGGLICQNAYGHAKRKLTVSVVSTWKLQVFIFVSVCFVSFPLQIVSL
jgi:hypothetical protein